MEEDKKSIRELLEELVKKESDPKEKKPKNNFFKDISSIGWILSVIFAVLGFIIGWIAGKDMTTGVVVAVIVFFVSIVVAKVMNQFPPFTARRLGKQKKRKGYVVFMNIGLNRAVTFHKVQVDEGVAMINDIPHVINSEDILIWKNKIPIVIQPQFSERPFSAREFHNLVNQNKEETKGWQYVMNYILKHQIKIKKDINWKIWIIGGIALVGLAWYLMKSGVLK